MIRIKRLLKGLHIWKAYSNGEEQEFIVTNVWYDSNSGRYHAGLDYVDDDYCKVITEDDEKDFYFYDK